MEYWLIFGVILILAGIIGSFIPVLPGPSLSFGALLVLYFVKGAEVISVQTLFLFGFVMLFLIAMDYLAPVMGAKVFGATKKGLIGAIIGGVFGIFFLPPLGIFIGSFLGAVIGESLNGKRAGQALRAGIGTLLGSVAVMIFQAIFSIVVAIYFLIKLVYIFS